MPSRSGASRRGIEPNFESVYKQVRNYVVDDHLRHLPRTLVYHAPEHTTDVERSVEQLAMMARRAGQLTERDVWLLKFAALFHDHGFTVRYEHNEPIGAKAAVKHLRKYGIFTANDLRIIRTAIEETQLKPHPDVSLSTFSQQPRSLHGQFLCDADLANLGRDDFLKQAIALHKEKLNLSPIPGMAGDFLGLAELRRNLNFLKGHVYYTPQARELFEAKKQENLRQLQAHIRELEGTLKPKSTVLLEKSEAHERDLERRQEKGRAPARPSRERWD